MSGRPRTTSFAESCKPAVPQPSAFGNMKVSNAVAGELIEHSSLVEIRVIANSSHSCFLIHRSVFKARHGGDPPYILDISFISRDVSGAEEQETERLWESLSILQQWWNFSLQCS
ncbi:glycogen synthase kinase 3 beta, genome duplicate b isoform X1 [Tachysurus ichikawai]